MSAETYRPVGHIGEGHIEMDGEGNLRPVGPGCQTVVSCDKCGALVVDTEKHDEWHTYAGVRAQFGLI